MGTFDPPETAAVLQTDLDESLKRSETEMPKGVTRLPLNRVEYWSDEELAKLDVVNIDVTVPNEKTTSGLGTTYSYPISRIRYLETRGFAARHDGADRVWGHIGTRDVTGWIFVSGYIRVKVKPGTNGFPALPTTESALRSVHPAALKPEEEELLQRSKQALAELAGKDLLKAAAARGRLMADIRAGRGALPGGTYAQQILETVTQRGNDYGHPSVNHQLTADLWSEWFSRKTGISVSFLAEDVCVFNILQKLSRLGERSKDDTWLDVMGFAENVSMLRPEQRNTGDDSTGADSPS